MRRSYCRTLVTHRILAPLCALLAHPSRTDSGPDESHSSAHPGRGSRRLPERTGQQTERERLESVQSGGDTRGVRLQQRKV